MNENIITKKVKDIPFERCFASHPHAIHWSNKNILLIKDVYISSRQEILLLCPDCKHDFKTNPNNVNHNPNKNIGCSYCSNRILCKDNNCKTCFDKSFASNHRSKYWDYNKNIIKPRDIFRSTAKERYWFICEDCNHSFNTYPNSIINDDNWCSYCCGYSLCDDNECKMCFDKSFASNPKSIYWSSNNIISPRKATKCSGNKFLFNCDKCKHEFTNQLDSVAKGSWCSYCATKTLCDDDNCKMCFDNSFASCYFQKYWSDKNKVKPRKVSRCSAKKYIFLCECGYEFILSCDSTKNKTACINCSNTTENILFKKLIKIYPNIKFQFRTEWCRNSKTKQYLPFDFVIEEYKVIIELDGGQHFFQVRNWTCPEEQQDRDKYKMKKALDNGYSVIRLLQDDVYRNKYNYLLEIDNGIQKIKTENKPQIIYICKKNEYKVYTKDL